MSTPDRPGPTKFPIGDRLPGSIAARVVPEIGVPVVPVPAEVLERYNARILDPPGVTRVAGQGRLRSTVYIADALLVRPTASPEVFAALDKAAAARRLVAARTPIVVGDTSNTTDAKQGRLSVTLVQLEPIEGEAAIPDAWEVLQAYRALVGLGSPLADQVALDHLLTLTRHVTSTPFDVDGGARMAASSSYGQPGWGGRAPVNWLGPVPTPRSDAELPCKRRPVVAVLDSGVGKHPWWDDAVPATAGIVQRNIMVNGVRAGMSEPSDTEGSGVVDDRLEGVLDAHSGHGTFIAGLIHQQCPDATILSVRVTPSSGALPEHVLLHALTALVVRQQQAAGNPSLAIDIVSLSLGYYDEQPGPAAPTPFLLDPIMDLGRLGVMVVVSAGNDATTRQMFPAAFTPHAGGPVTQDTDDCVPVTSVGAKNPNGTTALFSNDGAWVSCKRPGAALISTFPTTFNAAQGPAVSMNFGTEVRATVDPDDFSSGFGTWSGTSFAAPVLAGQLAALVLSGACGDPDPVDRDSAITRGRAAVGQALAAS